MLCKDCPKKNQCQELCPEMEAYANQDAVEWAETPISVYTQGEELRVYDPVLGTDRYYLSIKEKQILDAFGRGQTREEVAKNLNISMSTLRSHIAKLREKASMLSPIV